MSDEKNLEKLIPRIYKWKYESIGLFFFLKGQLSIFPTMSIQQCMNNFRRVTGITVDEWDDESMRAIFGRLQKEFYNCQSEISKKNNKL